MHLVAFIIRLMFCNLLWLDWTFSLVTFPKYKLVIYHWVTVLIFKDRYASIRHTSSRLRHYLYEHLTVRTPSILLWTDVWKKINSTSWQTNKECGQRTKACHAINSLSLHLCLWHTRDIVWALSWEDSNAVTKHTSDGCTALRGPGNITFS